MGKLASLLISHASPIDAQDRGGYTPLHFAACFGRIEIAVLLLNYGASPLVKAHSGATPLDLARSNNHDQICLLLQGRDEYASSAIKSEVLGPPPITEAMATAGSMQGRM
ncbi:SPT3 Dosage dependent suppressor of Ty-induced promoter mutations-like protein, partial [Spiromyces aspiralis]